MYLHQCVGLHPTSPCSTCTNTYCEPLCSYSFQEGVEQQHPTLAFCTIEEVIATNDAPTSFGTYTGAPEVIFEFENAFAFTHSERGTFNTKYYPEYTMRTIPHVVWQIKPIRLPKSREAEIMDMLEDQRQAGKYELSSSSYRSAVFAIEKKNGKLRLVHDLQPLNRVTI